VGNDGAGDFQFGATANMMTDTAAMETGVIRSRWALTGAGRSDARLSGGDAQSGVTVTECWDTAFNRVYVTVSPTGETAGNASDCVFADTLLPAM
jgi:hypothetical protein